MITDKLKNFPPAVYDAYSRICHEGCTLVNSMAEYQNAHWGHRESMYSHLFSKYVTEQFDKLGVGFVPCVHPDGSHWIPLHHLLTFPDEESVFTFVLSV